jgi:tetratricopeptide (TPR) repeat protein
VPDHPRIEELKRRVKDDPASLAFAHLAEEYRRAGRFDEAIETCRAGLKVHPNYLSARVTLGRALIERGQLDAAQTELQAVMSTAPDNLSAIRGLAEIHQRRGQNQEALDYYRWALEFAHQDPDLEKQVRDLTAAVEPQPPAAAAAPPEPSDADASPAPVSAPLESAPPEPGPPPAAAAAPVPPAATSTLAAATQDAQRLAVFKRLLDAVTADRERRHRGR